MVEEKEKKTEEIIKELIDDTIQKKNSRYKNNENNGIFKNYISKSKIGEKILHDFVKKYDENNRSFPLDDKDNKTKFGIITHAMALSTLLEIKSLNVNISQYNYIYFNLIENIFSSIYRDGKIVFDASPYLDNTEAVSINSYVETISKVLIVSVDLRDDLLSEKYNIENGISKFDIKVMIGFQEITELDVLINKVEELLLLCVSKLNDACLKLEEEHKKLENKKDFDELLYRGWSFHAPNPEEASEYEPSIYYTFHATNAFLSLYTSFSKIFDHYFEGSKLDLEIREKALSAKKENIRKKEIYMLNNKLAFYDRAEVKKLFNAFRERTISSGRYFELITNANNVDIAFDYIDKNLKPVDTYSIMNSGNNNYLMNSMFLITIFINAGLDDYYTNKGMTNYFYNQIQYALLNIKKMFELMVRNLKEDRVNTYVIGDEVCSVEGNKLIRALRKNCKNIPVYDFIPLYCITYSTISDYLIQYPQKEMINNLVWIMEKKQKDFWIWDDEFYDINNNLYYIFALEKFYNYYETYEDQFVNSSSIISDMTAQIIEVNNEKELLISEQEKEVEILKENFEQLLKEEREKSSPIEAEIVELVKKIFKDEFNHCLEGLIKKARDFTLSAVKEKGSYKGEEALTKQYKNDKDLQFIFGLSWAIHNNKGLSANFNEAADKEDKDNLMSMFTEEIDKNILQIIFKDNFH